MPLNQTEQLVNITMLLNLSWQQADKYLQANGVTISQGHYWKTRGKLRAEVYKRLAEIAIEGFEEQHLQRIDMLQFIQTEMLKHYFQEKDHFKAVKILETLTNLQVHIASFYGATKAVIERKNGVQGFHDIRPIPSPDSGLTTSSV